MFSQVTDIEKSIAAYREDAASIKAIVQEEVKNLGLARFSGTFYQVAKRECWAKIGWMIAAFLAGCCAAYFVFTSAGAIITNNFNITLVEFIQRLVDTLFFCFIAYWCAKRYAGRRKSSTGMQPWRSRPMPRLSRLPIKKTVVSLPQKWRIPSLPRLYCLPKRGWNLPSGQRSWKFYRSP